VDELQVPHNPSTQQQQFCDGSNIKSQ